MQSLPPTVVLAEELVYGIHVLVAAIACLAVIAVPFAWWRRRADLRLLRLISQLMRASDEARHDAELRQRILDCISGCCDRLDTLAVRYTTKEESALLELARLRLAAALAVLDVVPETFIARRTQLYQEALRCIGAAEDFFRQAERSLRAPRGRPEQPAALRRIADIGSPHVVSDEDQTLPRIPQALLRYEAARREADRIRDFFGLGPPDIGAA